MDRVNISCYIISVIGGGCEKINVKPCKIRVCNIKTTGKLSSKIDNFYP